MNCIYKFKEFKVLFFLNEITKNWSIDFVLKKFKNFLDQIVKCNNIQNKSVERVFKLNLTNLILIKSQIFK